MKFISYQKVISNIFYRKYVAIPIFIFSLVSPLNPSTIQDELIDIYEETIGSSTGQSVLQLVKGNATESEKKELASKAVDYIFGLNGPFGDGPNDPSPIAKEIEMEMAQHIIGILTIFKPEQMNTLVNKYRIESLSLNEEELKEKLINDGAFRKEIAERIGCVVYQSFRIFGWKSIADTKSYDHMQKYRERSNLDQIPPMFGPFVKYVKNLMAQYFKYIFDENGIIKLDDGSDELVAGLATIKFIHQLFPNTWIMIFEQTNMNQLSHVLAQAKTITAYERQNILDSFKKKISFFDTYDKTLEKILQKKQYNMQLIDQKIKQEQHQQQVKRTQEKIKRIAAATVRYQDDSQYDEIIKKHDKDDAIQRLQERDERMKNFADQFGLKNQNDPEIRTLLYKLMDHQNDLHKCISILTTTKNETINISSDSGAIVEKIAYNHLHDHGIYKLIPRDDFLNGLGISEEIGRGKYAEHRRLLNYLAASRFKEQGSRYQQFAESGLQAIKPAMQVKGKDQKLYLNLIWKLDSAIRNRNQRGAIKIIKQINALQKSGAKSKSKKSINKKHKH